MGYFSKEPLPNQVISVTIQGDHKAVTPNVPIHPEPKITFSIGKPVDPDEDEE